MMGVRMIVHRSIHHSTARLLETSPAVVLGAELEVAHDDADLGAGDGQDEHHRHQEAEDVVQLLLPHGGHHEHEFDQDGAERQNSRERNGNLIYDTN